MLHSQIPTDEFIIPYLRFIIPSLRSRLELDEGEHVHALETAYLSSPETLTGVKELLVLATNFVHGEDVLCRGKVYSAVYPRQSLIVTSLFSFHVTGYLCNMTVRVILLVLVCYFTALHH